MARKNGTELVKATEEIKSVAVVEGVQTDLPDYLRGSEKTGMERFGRADLKIPRIKLLQPLTPEVKSFQGEAIPGEFWHTVANRSLGTEFIGVVCIAAKRVILWRPRDDGDGGILAMSRDAVKWEIGANQRFEVKPKGVVKPIVWETKGSVDESGLTLFGTQNPEDPKSAPAATLSYEYLINIVGHPELSPVVLSAYKTGIPNAKAFNSFMFMQRKPITCMVAKFFVDEVKQGKDEWWVPNYKSAGWATKEMYAECARIAKDFEEYQIDLEQTAETDHSIKAVDDEIKY